METQQPPQAPSQQPAPQTPPRDKLLEVVIPINRSGWSVAAGYVALFVIPFVFLGPVAIGLGLVSLADIKKHPERAGRGRTWFAIIYGSFGTLLLIGWVYLLVAAANKTNPA